MMKWFPFGKKKKAKRRAIMDVSDSNFQLQVIQRSYKQPVMVDFWASWCAPCRQLGPVLERLAEDPDSTFILAKMNTEHNQRMPSKFGVRSIPAVKMFRNGRIVGEFTGVMPQTLVKKFIVDTLNAPAPSLGFKGSDNPAKRLQQAQHHLKKGNGFQAFAILNEFPDSPEADKAVQLLPLARFICDMEDGDGLTGLDELDDQYQMAARDLKRSKPAKALDHLLSALEVGEDIDTTYTTEIIESMFTLLGEGHKLTQLYRAKRITGK